MLTEPKLSIGGCVDKATEIYNSDPEKYFMPQQFINPANPDVHYRIRNAIMFVLSSDFEGLSNALLEAMMMGIPCISTNCAGSDEVIRNEKNGLLVNVGDEDGLYMAMKKLLENNELRKDISNQAKSDLSIFKSDKVLSEWMNYIDSEVIL